MAYKVYESRSFQPVSEALGRAPLMCSDRLDDALELCRAWKEDLTFVIAEDGGKVGRWYEFEDDYRCFRTRMSRMRSMSDKELMALATAAQHEGRWDDIGDDILCEAYRRGGHLEADWVSAYSNALCRAYGGRHGKAGRD